MPLAFLPTWARTVLGEGKECPSPQSLCPEAAIRLPQRSLGSLRVIRVGTPAASTLLPSWCGYGAALAYVTKGPACCLLGHFGSVIIHRDGEILKEITLHFIKQCKGNELRTSVTSGGITIIQKMSGRDTAIWLSGHGGIRSKLGLDNLGGFFQP